MSRSTYDLLNGPYRSERQRMAEEHKRQRLIEEARQQSALLQKLEDERRQEKIRKGQLFRLWFMMDLLLRSLEEQRDRNAPHSLADEWNPDFCFAIEKIPEVRRLCKDILFTWYNIDRSKYVTKYL